MLGTTFSTRDLAALLSVTETTVKRWADEGEIRCSKTLGGHRKFTLKDVIAFAEKHDYSLPGLLPPKGPGREAEQLEFNIQTGNYIRIADMVRDKALSGDAEGLTEILLHLLRHHIGIALIADEIVRPAMVRIGDLWKEGTLAITEEHIASHAILETILRVAPELHRKPANGRTAVFAGAEGDLHEIGLRLAACAFETDGWKVIYIGANTPFATLRSYVLSARADLLCLSCTLATGADGLLGELQSLGTLCRSGKTAFVCGGFSSGGHAAADLGCDYITTSVRDALQYARDIFALKPGPKPTRRVSVPIMEH